MIGPVNPLYAYSLLPVIAVSFLLCFTAALRGHNARGLSLYCGSLAVWTTALFMLCFARTQELGMRLAAMGALTAAGYLHAAWDATRQRSYVLVWLAWGVAVSLSVLGAFQPGLLHQPHGLGMGPYFWPAMALAVGAASLPLFKLAVAYGEAPQSGRAVFLQLGIAGLLIYTGALGNALLLAFGYALPFGMYLLLGGLLVLGFVVRAHEPLGERRLLDRSLRYSALGAFFYAALLFAVLWLMPAEPRMNQYRAGALLLFCVASLALEPVRQRVIESLGRRLVRDHAGAAELAQALKVHEERADQAGRLAELGGLVSAVAHEVRNPLGVLSAHVSVLEKRGADAETTQAMREQIQRASHFVDELLLYGRPRPLELRLVDLDATADLAISSARQGLREAPEGVQVERVRAGAAPVEADQGQLTQLLIVLVENALLALRDCPRRVLRVSTEARGASLGLLVEDSGPGIPAELMPRLFQPFVTGRKREGAGHGNGLGLAIARRIAERHGGALTAGKSSLGGALFELALPRVQPVLAAARQTSVGDSGTPYITPTKAGDR